MMNEFKKYLQQKDYTESTQETYLQAVNKFLLWYKDDAINTEKKNILKYLEYLKTNKKLTNRSRRHALTPIKHYFDFMLETEQIASNPTTFIKIRGTKKKQLYKIFTTDELSQLADDYYIIYIKNFDDTHIPLSTRYRSILSRQRNYIMLTFLIYQGLHTNELKNISLDDIDLIKARVKIRGTKRTNERILTLKAEQIGGLMNYLQNIRPQFEHYYKGESNALFLPLPKTDKTPASIRLKGTIQTLGNQLRKINENFLNFNQIRASFITHRIKTDGLRKAQYFAGHRYISSTENYLQNDIEALKDDMTKYNPF